MTDHEHEVPAMPVSDQEVPAPPSTDPNHDAIDAAGLDQANATWLRGLVDIVEPRLDAVRGDWREAADPVVARACAFGLLLATVAQRYPASREVLARVAEVHPSYGPLPPGQRLETLERIAGDGELTAAWVGPVLDVAEVDALAPLRQ
ncbi:MAG: hypothetical protein R6T85_01590 [Egibacteraceae bacterium]